MLLFSENWVESKEVNEKSHDAFSKLVEGVCLTILIHLVKLLCGDGLDNWADLSDQSKCVRLEVLHDVFGLAWSAFWFAVIEDIPNSGSEVAVLIVEEEKVNNVVSKLCSVLVGDTPDVASNSLEEVGNKLHVVWNPLSEAIIVKFLNNTAWSIETEVHTLPCVSGVFVHPPDSSPTILCWNLDLLGFEGGSNSTKSQDASFLHFYRCS